MNSPQAPLILQKLPIVVIIVLLLFVLTGMLSLYCPRIDLWTRPRFGTSWLLALFSLALLQSWLRSRLSLDLFFAGFVTVSIAVLDAKFLWNVGTVVAVQNPLVDQLHIAWFWQVGTFAILGLCLFWSAWATRCPKSIEPVQPRLELASSMEVPAAFRRRSKWIEFKHAPLVLQAFIVFAICSSLLELFFMFYTGQKSVGKALGIASYLSSMIMVHHSFTFGKITRKRVFHVVYNLFFFAVLATLAAFLQWLSFAPPNYLSQAVFQIVSNCFWAMLLLSPSMLKWIRDTPSDEYKSFQFSISDLVYLMFAVALASAAWIALTGRT